MKKLCLLSIFSGVIVLTSCSKDLSDATLDKVKASEISNSGVSFSEENSSLSFNSLNGFQDYMENYEKNEKEISNFYDEGFVPYKPVGNLDEQVFSNLLDKKQAILQKENILMTSRNKAVNNEEDEDYDEEDDDFITNDKFASLLNAKGEIIVGDSIYRFTPYGRFSSLVSKKEVLDKYIDNLDENYQTSEGTVYVTDDIQRFIPKREEFKKFDIVDNQDTSNSEIQDFSMTGRPLPNYTDHYSNCHNSRAHWIDRIFGVSYVCEYRFTSKRKLRTTFAVENYGIYMEIYGQAKFKQRTWFGWFSSRDAEKTYLRINYATLTFKEQELKFTSTQLMNALKYGEKLAKWMQGGNGAPVVNTISTPDDGVTNYVSSEKDNWWNKVITLPEKLWRDAELELDIDLGRIFDQRTHNVIVLSAFDKRYTVSNRQIMKNAYDALKGQMESLRKRPTGVFLVEHDTKRRKISSRSYSIFNELHESTGLAIVGRTFKLPKDAEIKNLVFSYSQTVDAPNSKPNFSWVAELIYPKVQNLDISMETGAYYRGQWGGSKLTIVYND